MVYGKLPEIVDKEPVDDTYDLLIGVLEKEAARVMKKYENGPTDNPTLPDVNCLEPSDSDIEVVISQTYVTRNEACDALRRNDNNIVDAIMELNV